MTEEKKTFDESGTETTELTEMRVLEEALRGLSTEARMPRDMWSDIRARITGEPVSQVVPLTSRRDSARRFSLTLGQLVAAGVAMAFLSGGSVWLALSSTSVPAGSSPVTVMSPGGATAVSDERNVAADTVEEYSDAVAELELILEGGRRVLGHETIQTIEESLTTIDEAIEESREALADDPGSDVLNRLLARNMWKKMEILRQTAGAIRARST